tara:strand:- start:3300 stop:4784 length:1485 start_codon:yes stop_codon:yes gene_type:complete
MKKVVIVGSGTAGLISAAMIKTYWGDRVDVSLYHDASKETISVGESTTPYINAFLSFFGIPANEIIRELDVTVKLGINFNNWIPNQSYFHGFNSVNIEGRRDDSPSTYSILNDDFNSGFLYNEPTDTVPETLFNDFSYGLHIDTKQFIDFLTKKLEGKINLVDDLVEDVVVENGNISRIVCKNSGVVEGDLFIDASGFNRILFQHLDPKWNDMSRYLPIDRAIPQQVPYEFDGKLPSYTVSEATENGWIWKIPIGDRYGTGYLYSSKFTSDEDAREKYNQWLIDNFNTQLETDRIIKYKPGYYEDYWIGNCLAVGLSSGFVEPLESTGIHLIIKQMYDLIFFNSNLENLSFNRKSANLINRELYVDIINFVALHYCTNRNDSEFWRYMTSNKLEWVQDLEEKCKHEFLDITIFRNNPTRSLWTLDSYIAVTHGLNILSKDAIKKHLESKVDGNQFFYGGDQILDVTKQLHQYSIDKKNEIKYMSHSKALKAMSY